VDDDAEHPPGPRHHERRAARRRDPLGAADERAVGLHSDMSQERVARALPHLGPVREVCAREPGLRCEWSELRHARRGLGGPEKLAGELDFAMSFAFTSRSMPAMPTAQSSPPIVVGISVTKSATRKAIAMLVPEKTAKGSSVTTTKRKMNVKPPSRISSAISLGVFCRSHPRPS
jgi:hypothetical protein